MRGILFAVVSLIIHLQVYAQPGPGKKGGMQASSGRIYGKIQDETTKASLEFTVLQVFRDKDINDSIPGELLGGGLSASNGDFSIDKIPVDEKLWLVVNLVGYDKKNIEFTLSRPAGPGAVEKDLGNIRLNVSATLGEVTIEGNTSDFRIEFDKRVYEVDKNPMNAGGTGEDVLRNIPSLQVDIDGNVSMRNSAPQIFIDGRPTTLTIDQIPADAIQRVEVITNPSAKYDASGGGGGIVNIVMKHNRGMGYGGNLRLGVDSRPRFNGGGDINLREGKFNFFVNGNYNQRKSLSEGTTDRLSMTEVPNTDLHQTQTSTNRGYFLNGKVGVDWFVDNRNTFTLSQSLTRGQFNPTDVIEAQTDTLYNTSAQNPYSLYTRNSETNRNFQNLGSSLLFKHLFAKEGTELSSDINVNLIKSNFLGNYENIYSDYFTKRQKQDGGGNMELYTSQTDFTTRPTESTKFEAGVRGSLRHYESIYNNYVFVDSLSEFVPLSGLLVNYEFYDQVYAAYSTFSKNGEKWKYQFGLRAESSDYSGRLRDTTLTFRVTYPISLFPSAYITRVINEKQDVQIALSRKINRPSFMQLIPFVDYSDSLNVSRGNPELQPEFTHLAEISWQNNISKKTILMATAYSRYITNLTVRNQVTEYSDILERTIVINTYDNARSSLAFGLEIVSKNSITDWFDLTVNLNLYQSSIDGTNISPTLTNDLASWWTKTNALFKLPGSFTFQAMFDYSSKKALTVGSSERAGGMGGGGGMGMGGGGGGGGFGGSDNTVQGYVRPTYGLDLSIKKEFPSKNLSFTLSCQDVLKSRINYTHSETNLFIQDTFRRRDWQFFRLNLSWKFGKVDNSIFKRKNMKQSSEGMEG